MSNLDTGYEDGSPKTYTLISAAIAAGSANDQVRLWCSTSTGNPAWLGGTDVTSYGDKFIGVEGMLDGRAVTIVARTTSGWRLNAGTSYAWTGDIYIRNLTFTTGYPSNSYPAIGAHVYNDHASTVATVTMERCVGYNLRLMSSVRRMSIVVKYSLCNNGSNGYAFAQNDSRSTNTKPKFINCGIIGGHRGFYFSGNSVHPLLHNCFVIQTYSDRIFGTVDSNSDYNFIDDTGEAVTGTNSRNDITVHDCKFAHDVLGNTEYGYSVPLQDARPTPGSVLINAGAASSDTESTDIDGKDIFTQPVGPSVGVNFGSTPRSAGNVVGKMRVR